MITMVTGITGLLGTAIVRRNESGKNIRGIYLGDYDMTDGNRARYDVCDITDKETLFRMFHDEDIECIIHTAGIANVDICEKEPDRAFKSNISGTKNIIELAKQKNAKIVYISTNAVFDGKNAPYGEEDDANPINRYGALKLECESLIKEIENYLIVRPILMYGIGNAHERKNFFIWIFEKLSAGEKVNLVTDVFENPLLSDQCADIIWDLIKKGSTGIYHVAGKDVLSRFEAGKIIARFFSLDRTLLNPVTSDFFPEIAPRPKNTSYCTEKIQRELNMRSLSFEEGLLIIKERMNERI